MSSTKPAHITVHHLSDSRSQRILWLLEELNVPYSIKKYMRVGGRAPPESYDISPLGRFPVISFEDKSIKADGEVTLAESGAIVEYLLKTYGSTPQLTNQQQIDDTYFTHYAEGSLMPLLVNRIIFTIAPAKFPWFIRPIARFILGKLDAALIGPQLTIHGKYVEEHLAKVSANLLESSDGKLPEVWFAGSAEPTAADYMMMFPIEAYFSRVDDAEKAAHCKKYIDKIHARPAYKRALVQGGEYKYAKP